MLTIQLSLTGLILLVAIALDWGGHRLSQKDVLTNVCMVAVCLLLLVWIPREWRDYLLLAFGIVFFLIATTSGGVGALVLGAFAIYLSTLIPGGGSVLLLGILAIYGGVEVGGAGRHLMRLSRAKKMLPGKIPASEVELGGQARRLGASDSPLPELQPALWRVKLGAASRQSGALIEVRGEHGLALLDPSGASFDLKEKSRALTEEELTEVIKTLGLESLAQEDRKEGSLQWVEQGAEVYVVGLPTWESSPRGVVGGYRESPMLPVFCAKDGHAVYLADRAAEAVRRDSLHTLFCWGGWGSVCGAIALVQFIFS